SYPTAGTGFEALSEILSMSEGTTFQFSYMDETFEANFHPMESKNSLRNFKINFPTVLNITEGSVEISELSNGEWEICKIFSADPIQKEFLHSLAQGFVENIDTQQSESI